MFHTLLLSLGLTLTHNSKGALIVNITGLYGGFGIFGQRFARDAWIRNLPLLILIMRKGRMGYLLLSY